MINFAVYNTTTGAVTRTGTCPPALMDIQARDGESVIECVDGVYTTTHKVVDGAFVLKTDADDTRTLDDTKAQAKRNLLAARDALDYSPFVANGVTYSASPDDQRRIAGAVQLAIIALSTNQPFSIVWDDASDNPVTLDGKGMIAVGIALSQSVQEAFARYRTALVALNAATTNSAVDAIVI